MMVSTCDDKNKTDSDLQILTPALQESIKNILEKENYTKYDVIIEGINTNGNNLFGKLYEIDIIGETTDCKKETNIFVKQRTDIKNFKLLSVVDAYTREMLFYTDLSKAFTSIQDQANVPLEDRFKIAKSYDGTDTNVILLENLSKRGFKTYEKMESVPIKYIELCIQQLAKFHALSFVIEHKMPEYYSNNIQVLKSPLGLDDDWKILIRNMCTYVVNLYNDKEKEKVQKFLASILENMPKYRNDESTVRCTLTHGDFKKNNILVRLEKEEPIEIIPVDYQVINYGCPIKDLQFFLFTVTDRQLRKENMNNFKELYFKTLSRFLKYFDMEVETVYPRQEFEKVYTEWRYYGLMMTLFANFVMFASDSGVDLGNLTKTKLSYYPNQKYDDIFRGLIDDFII